MLYPAIVVSHPCDRKKSQGWGTELRGYSNHGSTLSGMGASRSRREARDWDLSLFVTMTRHPTRRLQARTAGRRPSVGLSPRAGAPAWTARVFYRFLGWLLDRILSFSPNQLGRGTEQALVVGNERGVLRIRGKGLDVCGCDGWDRPPSFSSLEPLHQAVPLLAVKRL